jgi:hypothetical protein
MLLVSCVLSALETRAVASCGDWLAHSVTSDTSAQQAMSGTNSDAHHDGSVDDFTAPNQDSIPQPCDGPSCRQAPFRPVPIAPPQSTPATDKLLLAGHDVIREPLSRWTIATGDSSAHAIRGFPVDIEHPPRA